MNVRDKTPLKRCSRFSHSSGKGSYTNCERNDVFRENGFGPEKDYSDPFSDHISNSGLGIIVLVPDWP